MKFDINVWNDFRKKAKAIGESIAPYKNTEERTYRGISRRELQCRVDQITFILRQSDLYMESCGLGSVKKKRKGAHHATH